MRVCFISHSSRVGGAEQVLLETVEVLKNGGIECFVLLPARGVLCEELTSLGIPYSVVPYGLWMGHGRQSLAERAKAAARHLALMLPVLMKVRQWQCDIVYSNTITVFMGALVAALIRRPHVWHLHELGYEDHGLEFFFGKPLSSRLLNTLSSACICASKTLARQYSRYLNPNKLKTIYCSLHRSSEKGSRRNGGPIYVPARRGRFRCIIIGSVVEGKGQEDPINAIAELSGEGLSVELLIVGREFPTYGRYLREILARRNAGERVLFTGHVEDPSPLIASSDVVLNCSRCEAFGRTTVEGMLAGKPVIGSMCGANPELIRPGFNGLLYEPGDARHLAEQIRFLYGNPEAASQMGENGKAWACPMFTRERYSRELVEFLTSVAKHGRVHSHLRYL